MTQSHWLQGNLDHLLDFYFTPSKYLLFLPIDLPFVFNLEHVKLGKLEQDTYTKMTTKVAFPVAVKASPLDNIVNLIFE